MKEYFIDNSISSKAINNFFRKMNDISYEIHTIQIYQNNKQVLRIAQAPYSCTHPREVYSLSKMFTSTVVGIASDMGLLSADDKVVDFFPEIGSVSENFSKMKISHLLSMNTGHSQCIMPKINPKKEVVKTFFSIEPEFEPGTHFAYNTAATYMLAFIIERVTGKSFFDFACEKLFYPLGITDVYWSKGLSGVSLAGTGLHISNDDIIKLGLMYANKGIYNGRRILSEEWILEASSPISDNSSNGSPDWTNGYGYQIWMNSRDGYRGDGACGQLCMILPKYDAVVAVQAIGPDMQKEIDIIFELLEELHNGSEESETFEFKPMQICENVSVLNKSYLLDSNAQGFKTAKLTIEKDSLALVFSDGYAMQKICAGNGEWKYSSFTAASMTPLLYNLMPTGSENIKAAACFTVQDGKIRMLVRYLTNPHSEVFEITADEKLHIQIKENGSETDENWLRKPNTYTLTGTQI